MDLITIKTPNTKCRLWLCLIEFIDWRNYQSCWYIIFNRPWTSDPLTFKTPAAKSLYRSIFLLTAFGIAFYQYNLSTAKRNGYIFQMYYVLYILYATDNRKDTPLLHIYWSFFYNMKILRSTRTSSFTHIYNIIYSSKTFTSIDGKACF